jgi:hypothetical protein
MPHHAHSIDRWDDATGSNLYEHLAGVNDLLLARATFAAAVQRWKTWPADNLSNLLLRAEATAQAAVRNSSLTSTAHRGASAKRRHRAWRWMRATG